MIYIITLSCLFHHIDKKPVKVMTNCSFQDAIDCAQQIFNEKCNELGYQIPSPDDANCVDESVEGYWLRSSHPCLDNPSYKQHVVVEVWSEDMGLLTELLNKNRRVWPIVAGDGCDIEPFIANIREILSMIEKESQEHITAKVRKWFLLEFAQCGQNIQHLMRTKDGKYSEHNLMSVFILELATEFVDKFCENVEDNNNTVLTHNRSLYDLFDEFIVEKEQEIYRSLDEERKLRYTIEASETKIANYIRLAIRESLETYKKLVSKSVN